MNQMPSKCIGISESLRIPKVFLVSMCMLLEERMYKVSLVKSDPETPLGECSLLEAKGIATNGARKLLGAPGLTTRNKDATRSKGQRLESNCFLSLAERQRTWLAAGLISCILGPKGRSWDWMWTTWPSRDLVHSKLGAPTHGTKPSGKRHSKTSRRSQRRCVICPERFRTFRNIFCDEPAAT